MSNSTKTAQKRAVLYILLVLALASIATVLIVAISLSNKPIAPPVNNDPDIEQDVDNQPVKMLKPVVGDYTIDLPFAYDTHVWLPTLGISASHEGIDLKAEKGAMVVAVLDGVVVKAEDSSLYGGVISIDHGDGVISTYKSVAREPLLKVGDSVKRGDVIGTVSDNMIMEIAQEAHLHFEITVNGQYVNPATMIEDLVPSEA